MTKIKKRDMIRVLRRQAPGAGFIDRLKISYRPMICPFEPLLREVAAGSYVFDIGCGSGQFALLLAHFTLPAQVTGVEIESRLVQNARALLARAAPGVPARFENFNGRDFPAELRAADTVFLIDVLHHVPAKAQEEFLAAIFRGMRPGARLILKDIDAASPLVVCNKIHDLLLSGEPGHELNVMACTTYLQRSGFTIESVVRQRMLWYPHYTIAAVRSEAA